MGAFSTAFSRAFDSYLILSISAGSTTGANVTTGSIDTTGATLIVLIMHTFTGGISETPSDNKSNTWSLLTPQDSQAPGRTQICYCINPTVGAGHTFTITTTGGGFPSITVFATNLVSPSFDVENGNVTASGTSLNSNNVTPSANGALVISGLTPDNAATTFTVSGGSLVIKETVPTSGGNNMNAVMAYEIQTTATLRSATWGWTNAVAASAAIAVFIPGGGGGGGNIPMQAFLVSP